MRKGICLQVTAAVLLLALALFLAAGCGGDSPGAAVEKFVKAAAENDCDTMVDMIASDSLKMAFGESKEDAVKACKESQADGGESGELTKFDVLEETIDGDNATVKFSATAKLDGEEETDEETVDLIKEDGKWKVKLF